MFKQSMIVLSTLIILTGCHHKKAPETDPEATSGRGAFAGGAVAVAPGDPSAQVVEQAAQQLRDNFRRVHFEFDSATLTPEAKRLLSENAVILKKYPDLKIEIQGHCDERGTTDYNLALGQSRARTVQRYLMDMGVAKAQLTTTSFGEERPLVRQDDEMAWAANRRAEFRVTVGGDGLVEDTLSQPADYGQM